MTQHYFKCVVDVMFPKQYIARRHEDTEEFYFRMLITTIYERENIFYH